jgi:secondary thiamine-phosphate synthase enzyme
MQEFSIQTTGRTGFISITAQVEVAVRELGIEEGAVLVYCPHTTGAVTINEGADPDVVRDLDMELGRIVPFEDGYRHGEGNSAAHIKSSLVGCSELVAVSGGRLVLGTWQTIYFCEFDGPRRRRVLVQRV